MQYNNGVVEHLKPSDNVFEDKEILKLFGEYEELRTKRLVEVPNAWCIWGENKDKKEDPEEFNNLGAKVVGEKIYSPLLILHDSELNPELHLTDKIIIKPYEDFKNEILGFLDGIAQEILDNFATQSNLNKDMFIPNVEAIGPTKDKRLLMKLDLEKQIDDFFRFDIFTPFATQSFNYLHKYLNSNLRLSNNAFIIFADKKTVLIIPDDQVENFLRKIIDNYEKREKYRACDHILRMLRKWKKYVEGNRKPLYDEFMNYVEDK